MSAAYNSETTAAPVPNRKLPTVRRTAILLNPNAGGGRARRGWAHLRDAVLARLPAGAVEIELSPHRSLAEQLRECIEREGTNGFVAVGGDGTLHALVNALLPLSGWEPLPWAIGAIGLGSSNDFHKPYRTRIGRVPVRLDWRGLTAVDVGQVQFRDPTGRLQQRFFLINASLGVTAAANHFFNHGDTVLRRLKSHWTAGAISYAAIRTILGYRNFPAMLHFANTTKTIALTNLAVLKSPHVSGSFRYDQAIDPADGQLGFHYCDGLTKVELLRLLWDLGRGRFRGRPRRYSHRVRTVQVTVPHAVPLETDGEVYPGTDFVFSVLPQHLPLFGHGN